MTPRILFTSNFGYPYEGDTFAHVAKDFTPVYVGESYPGVRPNEVFFELPLMSE